MWPKLGQSDGSVKSSKSSFKSLKVTLKWKASNIIKAVIPKKKKNRALDGDTLSLLSAEESDNGNGNKDSQPAVIDVDGSDDNDDEKSDDVTEEDVEAELGRSFFF